MQDQLDTKCLRSSEQHFENKLLLSVIVNSIIQVMQDLSPDERWQELEQGSGPRRQLRWNLVLRNIIAVEIIDFLNFLRMKTGEI